MKRVLLCGAALVALAAASGVGIAAPSKTSAIPYDDFSSGSKRKMGHTVRSG